jgi:hypothetical protein
VKTDTPDVVRFEVSTAVTMMIIIFWEMTTCGSYKLEAIRSSETSVLIRATRCHLPEDDINSSVVKLLSYGLNCRGVEVRFPEVARDLSLLHSVQNGFGVHLAFNTMGTGGCITWRGEAPGA